MSRRPRRNYSPAFKEKLALAAIRGEKTISEPAEQFDVQPDQISTWREQLLKGRRMCLAGRRSPSLRHLQSM